MNAQSVLASPLGPLIAILQMHFHLHFLLSPIKIF